MIAQLVYGYVWMDLSGAWAWENLSGGGTSVLLTSRPMLTTGSVLTGFIMAFADWQVWVAGGGQIVLTYLVTRFFMWSRVRWPHWCVGHAPLCIPGCCAFHERIVCYLFSLFEIRFHVVGHRSALITLRKWELLAVTCWIFYFEALRVARCVTVL